MCIWYNDGVMSADEPCDTYVDTSFLMNAPGREYLLQQKSQVKVIRTVMSELAHHAQNPESVLARELMEQQPTLFDVFSTELSEERDARKGMPEGKFISADSVFRRVAIRCMDTETNVRFLTADTALAETLAVYPTSHITCLLRQRGELGDWRVMRERMANEAQQAMLDRLGGADVVLTASVLRSPYLLRFLQNVQAVNPDRELLPIVHKISIDSVLARGHVSREVLELLDDRRVVRRVSVETPYRTETAMLDAVYGARCQGKDIHLLVADWELAEAMDARSRGHELRADVVSFRLLTPWGDTMPLLKDWRRRLEDGRGVSETVQAESSATALIDKRTFTEQPPETRKTALSMEDLAHLAHQFNPKVGVRVRQGTVKTIVEELRGLNPQQPEAMLVLGILSARRQNKPELAEVLISSVSAIHPYCLGNWFRAGNGAGSPKSATIVKSDVYFRLTKRIIAISQNLAPCTGLVQRLKTLRPHAPVHVDELLRQVMARGAK